MSLAILLIAEIIIWVIVNRSTPFSTPRLNILRDVTGTAAFFAGLYVALCFGIGVYAQEGNAFIQVTILNPIDALVLCLGNLGLWSVLAVRQHSMAHQH